MAKVNLIKRYFIFIVGAFIMALGTTLIIKAKLGSSALSSLPYVLSLTKPKLSLGEWTFAFNIVLIILQFIIQKKDFKVIELLQIPLSVVFGTFIDFTSYLILWIEPNHFLMKLIVLMLGSFILALGITITIIPNVIIMPGEAIVRVIASKLNKEFGTIKTYFDIVLISLACILSFSLTKEIIGVGIGTLLSASFVGTMSRKLYAKLIIIYVKLVD